MDFKTHSKRIFSQSKRKTRGLGHSVSGPQVDGDQVVSSWILRLGCRGTGGA